MTDALWTAGVPPGDTSRGTLEGEDSGTGVRYLGWWTMVGRRFRRHPLALTGALVLGLMVLLVVLGPRVAPDPLPAFNGQGLTPTQVAELSHRDTPPQVWPLSWRYLLGTDHDAQPVLRTVLIGGQGPLTIGIVGALIATFIGIVYGALAGYVGGWVDAVMMRTVDAFLAMPFIPLVLLATTSLSLNGVTTVTGFVVLFGLLGWPNVARLIRGYVLSLREWEFVQAARAVGLSEPAIVFRQILPNVLGIMVVSLTLNMAVFIAAEVTLDFLNPGGAGQVTWGAGIHTGYDLMLIGEWWISLCPAAAVLLVILGVNLLGDGLRDAIDDAARDAGSVGSVPRIGRLIAAAHAGWDHVSVWLRQAGSVLARRWLPASRSAGHSSFPPAGRQRRDRWSLPGLGTWRLPRRARFLLEGRWTVVPVIVVFLGAGIAFLATNAPQTYAPHYPMPQRYVAVPAGTEYGAEPLLGGGWDLLHLTAHQDLIYQRVDGQGRVVLTRIMARGSTASIATPTLTRSGQRELAVWTESRSGQDVVRAAYVRGVAPGAIGHAFSLAGAGSAAQPAVLAMPDGAFGVLFGRRRGTVVDIMLARIAQGTIRPQWIHRLVRPRDLAAWPHGVLDGSGHLDLLYLDRCCNSSVWNIEFRRFTSAGVLAGGPQTIGSISNLGPLGQPSPVPAEWAMDIQRGAKGSVWAASLGDYGIFLGHWSRIGTPLLHRQQLPCDPGLCLRVRSDMLAVVGDGRRTFVFLTSGNLNGVHPYGARFDDRLERVDIERMAYDYGGGAAQIRAARVGASVSAIWEKDLYTGQTILEGTMYRSAVPLDLAARLGLNLGPVWGNVAVVVLGALLAGIPFTAINVFFLALLLAVWAVLGHLLRGALRWVIYLVTLTGIVAWSFAVSADTPGFVFVLHGWHGLEGWIAVVGASFLALWTGGVLLRHQDDWFRAGGAVVSAVYFLAVLTAVVGLQGQVAQV